MILAGYCVDCCVYKGLRMVWGLEGFLEAGNLEISVYEARV